MVPENQAVYIQLSLLLYKKHSLGVRYELGTVLRVEDTDGKDRT